MATPQENDKRKKEVVKHLRKLATRRTQPLSVQAYLEYRLTHAPHLPTTTTIYRMFGSWPGALREAGIEQGAKSTVSRTEDAKLVAALKECATDLDQTVISSHAYDDWRKRNIEKWKKVNEDIRPSSSVIRKWLGPWAVAVEKAGLETSKRAVPRRRSYEEIIESLRHAKEMVEGKLTQAEYSIFYNSLSEEDRERWPDAQQILAMFPNWDAALRQADVEQADGFHPDALWTAEEARHIHDQVIVYKGVFDREAYEEVAVASKRELPTWEVITYLLKM
jgi:hypothetical protein